MSDRGAGPEQGGWPERLGVLGFGQCMRVLPGWLREEFGAQMVETFRARQAEARAEGGWAALVVVWWREAAGLAAAAAQARRSATASTRSEIYATHGQCRRTAGHPGTGGRMVEQLLHDARTAFRGIRRRRPAAATTVATIALGVAASSAMFSVVDGVVLQPLPYPDPEEIVMVYPTIPDWRGHATLGGTWDRGWFSYPEFVEWRAAQQLYERVAAYDVGRAALTGAGTPEQIITVRASPEIFEVFRIGPAIGRWPDPSEAGEGSVAVVSHDFWRRRFGGDPGAVGRTLRLSDRPHTIIGVLPAGFRPDGLQGDVWLPLGGPAREDQRGDHGLRVIGRLRDGVTVARAEEETTRLLTGFSASDHIQHGARVVPRLEELTRESRTPLQVLFLASTLLLVVACVNAAALLFSAGVDREVELSIRGAIGGTRRRIATQLLTEVLVQAAIGGVVGLVLGMAGTRLLALLAPADLPRMGEVGLDLRTVGFAFGTTLVAGVVAGLAPAVSLSRTDLARTIRTTCTGDRGRRRVLSGFVVAQLAAATVLLVGAGLLTRTMVRLSRVDPGFRAEKLLTVRVAPIYSRFGSADDPDAFGRELGAYFEEIVREIGSLPGVHAVAVTGVLPFSTDRASNTIEPSGYEPVEGEVLDADRRSVSWNYFRTTEIPIVDGRDFTEADDRRDAEPVVIVGESLARRFWPGRSAVGERLTFGAGTFRVIGVVGDVRERGLSGDAGLKFYVPSRKLSPGDGKLVIRTTGDPAALVGAVRSRIWNVDPDLPITSAVPMHERMSDSIAGQRYRMRLMSTFAVLAILLAALGTYGVIDRSVAGRRREIGIRLALGALGGGVVRLVLKEALLLIAAGVGVGLLAAAFATRALDGLLYGVERYDPVTLGLVLLLVALAGLAAAFSPARKAARTDPITVLRFE